jgi:hypothetical protein
MKNLEQQLTDKKVFILETFETVFDISVNLFLVKGIKETKLCYRTYNHGDFKETGYALKTTVVLDKKEVLALVKEYFFFSLRWHGLPRFNAPGYLNQQDLDEIILALKNEINEMKDLGRTTKNGFTDYLESQSLNPEPTGDHKYSWQANCPFSGGNHHMMISTKDNTYGCGWCHKKGNQRDLEVYFKEAV